MNPSILQPVLFTFVMTSALAVSMSVMAPVIGALCAGDTSKGWSWAAARSGAFDGLAIAPRFGLTVAAIGFMPGLAGAFLAWLMWQ